MSKYFTACRLCRRRRQLNHWSLANVELKSTKSPAFVDPENKVNAPVYTTQ